MWIIWHTPIILKISTPYVRSKGELYSKVFYYCEESQEGLLLYITSFALVWFSYKV